MAVRTAISPRRDEDYAEWYQQVIKAAELAEHAPVRGCMVIRPWGYALWENMQRLLDRRFKETGHVNAYFPLFIPKSYLEREAAHIEGFAKECAVVTHARLEARDGKLEPAAPLEEPLIVRPTSETIIGETYAKWVQSYRDLPILINQWANVVRWEMRTRLFMRTSEFLWQEGHTAHATRAEAEAETRQMIDVYAEFAEGAMAMPVLVGEKSEAERFPGALNTFAIEAMMQDGRALQAGTSHFLGQNFARAFGIDFLNEAQEQSYAWTTSWGVSTRLIGGLIMTHSDDDGLVLPPRLAPLHVVILPILSKAESRERVLASARELEAALRAQTFWGEPVAVQVDVRDLRGGEKTWQWVKKGVPLRVEIGPRDVDADQVMVARRDTGEKAPQPREAFVAGVVAQLQAIQDHLLERARAFRQAHTVEVDSQKAFEAFFKRPAEGALAEGGGFVRAWWAGDASLEKQLQERLKVTLRCLPTTPLGEAASGTCLFTGQPSGQQAIFAKAY